MITKKQQRQNLIHAAETLCPDFSFTYKRCPANRWRGAVWDIKAQKKEGIGMSESIYPDFHVSLLRVLVGVARLQGSIKDGDMY